MNFNFSYRILLIVLSITSIVSCTKEEIKRQGHYNIKTLTNSLDIPVKVEMAKVTKKLNGDFDYAKNLVYYPLADLQPKQTVILDSVFVCTENCEVVLSEGDPEFEPIFLRLTFNGKIKIDINCNHTYVFNGLIKNCQPDKKNYFNQKYHTLSQDQSGNSINDYTFNNDDWEMAK